MDSDLLEIHSAHLSALLNSGDISHTPFHLGFSAGADWELPHYHDSPSYPLLILAIYYLVTMIHLLFTDFTIPAGLDLGFWLLITLHYIRGSPPSSSAAKGPSNSAPDSRARAPSATRRPVAHPPFRRFVLFLSYCSQQDQRDTDT